MGVQRVDLDAVAALLRGCPYCGRENHGMACAQRGPVRNVSRAQAQQMAAELRVTREELEAAHEFADAFDRWRNTHEGWQTVLDARRAWAFYDPPPARERLEAAHRAANLVRAARAEVRRLLDGEPMTGAAAQLLRRVHTDLDEAVALTDDRAAGHVPVPDRSKPR